jgi:protein-tyrosine phosphatase
MSRFTLAALREQGIPWEPYLRLPRVATDEDFQNFQHVVAVKEAEHRPLIERNFPRWLQLVEFWHVHDLDCSRPEETLPHLDREVAALIERLRGA